MFTTTKLCCNAFGLTSSRLASSHRPFPDLDQEASCPSALAFTCQCRRARAHARAALCRATDHYFTLANHQRSLAPAHQFGQRVWLPTKDLSLPKYSKKLALRFVGSFTINQVFRPPVRSENWPSYVRIYPACHFSKIKPGSQEPLNTAPPPSACIIDGAPVYAGHRLLHSYRQRRVNNTWSTGRVANQRRDPGSPFIALGTCSSSESFMPHTLTSLDSGDSVRLVVTFNSQPPQSQQSSLYPREGYLGHDSHTMALTTWPDQPDPEDGVRPVVALKKRYPPNCRH